MVALAIVVCVVVALLAVLVAGLLRSHADILRALHELGVGVGDPVVAADRPSGQGAAGGRPVSVDAPLYLGPPLPAERSSTSAPTVAGVTPGGDALAFSVARGDQLTLLAFLSSGCATCAGLWQALRDPDRLDLPAGTRVVAVTKGPELESPADVGGKAGPRLTVVMSTDAWRDYEVPGSPFFVLVDGRAGRRIGEGVANHLDQVADLVRRADADARSARGDTTPGGSAAGTDDLTGIDRSVGLDGPARELANDRELMAAGIYPGDPSLYPSSLDDLYGRDGRGSTAPAATDHRAGEG